MPLLEIEDLQVRYGAIEALRGISLYVDQGEVVAVLGSNGAGKTTTLNTISGLIRPSGGKAVFDGTDLHDLTAHGIVGGDCRPGFEC